MQIQLVFSTDMLNLPISYSVMIQGFIYKTLSLSNPDFSAELHNKGRENNIDKMKLFTFGRLYGDYYIKHLTIIFPKCASLEIRSPDITFVNTFMSGCKVGDWVRLGKNDVKIEKCTVYNNTITDNKLHVRTASPFTYKVAHSNDSVFSVDVAKIQLINNARQKWMEAGKNICDFAFDVQFPNTNIKRTHCVFKGCYITGWETDFYISGSPETLDFIYNTGIGARNSQGFGMLEVLS